MCDWPVIWGSGYSCRTSIEGGREHAGSVLPLSLSECNCQLVFTWVRSLNIWRCFRRENGCDENGGFDRDSGTEPGEKTDIENGDLSRGSPVL